MRSSPDVPTPFASSRLASLDGLRGIAALVVVLFHVAMLLPALAAFERDPPPGVDLASILAYSPLRLLWSGNEAVVVFFVLSGFVLALPLRSRAANWFEYYPRRLVRLYVPVWASIALALAWTFAVPRADSPGASWWLALHQAPVSARGLAADATLLLGTTVTNTVLWSLRWEMWFSLLLPLYLWLFLRHRRFAAAKLLALACLTEAGQLLHVSWLQWMPVFGLGVIAAAEFDRIRPVVAGFGRVRGTIALVVVLVLLEAHWTVQGTIPLRGVAALGGLGLLVMFAAWPPVMRCGVARPVAWLGRVSFSLYLVHEPVVVSFALILGTENFLVVAPVALAVSLVLAAGFYRFVELPAHHLAKTVGRVAAQRLRSGRAGERPVQPGRDRARPRP